ncbi:dedD protein [Catenovulum agarivorans DS-2]|uniref:DedD protein n=1 Tax=Catenovulum agarivorans DS-2 TaxID=1328313 RepID=W7QSU4_9ALTE|nr:SPOR domain-containing protein [Catenovulum agarivorans]EWH12082.1 dedD protein [Catenovulum agarivorans DS-2]
MATTFQNRLVGSIVFVALIVIFLPDLLDGKKTDYGDQFQTIPAKPVAQPIPDKMPFPETDVVDSLAEFEQKEVDEQAVDEIYLGEKTAQQAEQTQAPSEQTETVTAQVSPEQQVTQAKAKPKTQSDKTTKTAKNEVPSHAWVIQLGSFRHKNNVQNLREKLQQEGYVSFTRPIKTQSGELTKVYVGPELDKDTLERMLPGLKRLTNLNGKISQYQTTE